MSVIINTSHGSLTCQLYCELVYNTCKNFLALAASDYYNNTIFHRNIKGFMIQGGDPTNTGKGGENIYDIKKGFNDEFNNDLKHDKRGVISMANSGPNTNKSQFFITYNKHTSLDNKYTVFGCVVDGFEVLDKMEKEPVDISNKKYKPLKDIILISITILSNPIAIKERDNYILELNKENSNNDNNNK